MRNTYAACLIAVSGLTVPSWADSTGNRTDREVPPPAGKIVGQTQPRVLFSRPFHTIGGYPVTVQGNRAPDEFGIVRPLRVPNDYVGDPADLPSYFWEQEAGVVRSRSGNPGYVNGRLPLNRYIRQLQYGGEPIYESRDEFGVVRPMRRVSVVDDSPTIGILRGEPSDPAEAETTSAGSVVMPEGVTTIYAAGKTLAQAPEAIRDDAWALLNAGWYRDAARLFERGEAEDATTGRAAAVLLLGRLDEAEELLTSLESPSSAGRIDAATAAKLRAMREFVSEDASSAIDALVQGR